MAKQLNLLDPNAIKNHKLKPDKDEEWLRDGGNLFCRVKRPEETNKVFFYRGRYNGSPMPLIMNTPNKFLLMVQDLFAFDKQV